MHAETIKYLTTEEVCRLLKRMTSLRDRAMFGLMYWYGLRCVEAAGLNRDDVRLSDGRIFIRAAKKGITGDAILSKAAQRALEAYLHERDAAHDDSLALFVSRKGSHDGRLSATQIYRLFRHYAQAANLPNDKRHPHVLRHSIAVHMADSGIDVAVVREHLRHRRIENTMTYFQITDRRRFEFQARALEGKFVAQV